MTSKKQSRIAWALSLCSVVLIPCVLLGIRGSRSAARVSGPLGELRAQLSASGFFSEPSGRAIGAYLEAVMMLRADKWTEEKLGELLQGQGAPLTDDSIKVLDEATSFVVRGAKLLKAGLPRLSSLDTTISVGSQDVKLSGIILARDAARVVARYRLLAGDHKGAVNALQGVLAMGLHLMTSDHYLTAVIGVSCCQEAMRSLRDVELQQGDVDSVKKYDAALIALDEEFQRIKKVGDKEPSFLDIMDVIWGD